MVPHKWQKRRADLTPAQGAAWKAMNVLRECGVLARWAVISGALAVTLALASPASAAIPFSLATVADRASLDAIMPSLAEALLATFHDRDHRHDLDTRFRLEMVAGRWSDAQQSLQALHAHDVETGHMQSAALNLQYMILVKAHQLVARSKLDLDAAFAWAFHESMDKLDDRTSALVCRALMAANYPAGISLHIPIRENLAAALLAVTGKAALTDTEALQLLRSYQVEEAYRDFAEFAPNLVAEEDHTRYVEEELAISVDHNASVCAEILRPKTTRKRPTLLEFTIYADHEANVSERRRSASNGYIGVTGYTRGKACGSGDVFPYEHDGHDGAALIDWISHQPWSDGRVATFGASYDGFTQWAIAKHHPKALVAMMDSVAAAPGVSTPMDRGAVVNADYGWIFYTTDNKTLDLKTYSDNARWNRLFRNYYLSGAAYRALPQIDGPANAIFERRLDHPTYDVYWRDMIPYGAEFAAITIPILTITGYYQAPGDGAIYYLTQQLAQRPNARHFLVVGPYDHTLGNRGTIDVLGEPINEVEGTKLDPSANIDFGDLRYRWFDYVLRSAPKPSVLVDRINYEVMGENLWRHVSNLNAVGPVTLTLHPEARGGESRGLLAPGEGRKIVAATMSVDLADRTDVDRAVTADKLIDDTIDTNNAVVFETAAFDSAVELSGLYVADLDVVSNKKDFDFELALYEVTTDRHYARLAHDFERASAVKDYTKRILLTVGRPTRLKFQASLFMARQFQAGSRLLLVIRAVKSPFAEINYGTSKPVADGTIADASAPLELIILSDSTLQIPTRPLIVARQQGSSVKMLGDSR